ncbi:UNVERIFIED_CONTAM: Serrate RNA effector molecule, partial [Sesamum indicum]
MAEVLSGTSDNLDQDNNANPTDNKPSTTAPADAGPDSTSSPPPPPRRPTRDADRDSRERRDDRPPRRGYHDRHRSPPPPPPRERDYHKRGRPSPSPPPPYRDRRGGGPHSPPSRRSSPFPPYKRRRDDGYDGRRGSPRGGYGPADRRFGYDYEHDMGGRPGYPDERFHGRYMGRQSAGYPGGPSDWDSGRSGFADTFGASGAQREGMMSYKQFIQELEDDVLPAEAERRLKDKYHPTNLLAVIERRNEVARKSAKNFQLDLQRGTLDFDENAPGGRPVMQPSFPKERPRHRPGPDNRIKDERGNRRERDYRANERFDRSENPQSGDFTSSNDGPPGENPDEMFDTFGAQGIPVAHFPSDIPPPVLMPVPGAG